MQRKIPHAISVTLVILSWYQSTLTSCQLSTKNYLLLRILLLLWMMKPLVTISKRWWKISGCFSEKAKCFLWVCGSSLWLLSKIKKNYWTNLKRYSQREKLTKQKNNFCGSMELTPWMVARLFYKGFKVSHLVLLTLTAVVTGYYFVLNIYKTAASLVAKDWSVLLGLRMLFYCS